jgi:hypothetical protein
MIGEAVPEYMRDGNLENNNGQLAAPRLGLEDFHLQTSVRAMKITC